MLSTSRSCVSMPLGNWDCKAIERGLGGGWIATAKLGARVGQQRAFGLQRVEAARFELVAGCVFDRGFFGRGCGCNHCWRRHWHCRSRVRDGRHHCAGRDARRRIRRTQRQIAAAEREPHRRPRARLWSTAPHETNVPAEALLAAAAVEVLTAPTAVTTAICPAILRQADVFCASGGPTWCTLSSRSRSSGSALLALNKRSGSPFIRPPFGRCLGPTPAA